MRKLKFKVGDVVKYIYKRTIMITDKHDNTYGYIIISKTDFGLKGKFQIDSYAYQNSTVLNEKINKLVKLFYL